jgi:hypothetical protein
MLRGRSPWGLRGAVYLLVRLFIHSQPFIRRCEVVDAFYWGSGDVIEGRLSTLDRTGASIGEQCSRCYREGVPTVVVFKISPSENFSPPPQRSQPPPGPIARYATSPCWLWIRSRFVAVTTYRCRVRFRRPRVYYIIPNICNAD